MLARAARHRAAAAASTSHPQPAYAAFLALPWHAATRAASTVTQRGAAAGPYVRLSRLPRGSHVRRLDSAAPHLCTLRWTSARQSGVTAGASFMRALSTSSSSEGADADASVVPPASNDSSVDVSADASDASSGLSPPLFGPPAAPMPSSLSAAQRRAVLAMMSLYDLRKRYAVTFPVRRVEALDELLYLACINGYTIQWEHWKTILQSIKHYQLYDLTLPFYRALQMQHGPRIRRWIDRQMNRVPPEERGNGEADVDEADAYLPFSSSSLLDDDVDIGAPWAAHHPSPSATAADNVMGDANLADDADDILSSVEAVLDEGETSATTEQQQQQPHKQLPLDLSLPTQFRMPFKCVSMLLESAAHASPLSVSEFLEEAATSPLADGALPSDVRLPPSGVTGADLAEWLLHDFRSSSTRDRFEWSPSAWTVVLKGLMDCVEPDSLDVQAQVARVRAFYDAIPDKQGPSHSIMMAVYEMCGDFAAAKALHDSWLHAPNADFHGSVTIARLRGILLQLTKCRPPLMDPRVFSRWTLTPAQASLVEEAESLWQRAKRDPLQRMHPLVTARFLKIHQLLGDVSRQQSIIAEALQLEAEVIAAARAQADRDSLLVVERSAPVYVDATCYGELFTSFTRNAEAHTYAPHAKVSWERMHQRHADAVARRLNRRARELMLTEWVRSAYFTFLQRSGQVDELRRMWDRVPIAERDGRSRILLSLMHAYAESDTGDAERLAAQLDELRITWRGSLLNAWLSGYRLSGDWRKAESVWARLTAGHLLNSTSYRALMEVYMHDGSPAQLAKIEPLYQQMTHGTPNLSPLPMQVRDFETLIRTARRCRLVGEASQWGIRARAAGAWPKLRKSTRQLLGNISKWAATQEHEDEHEQQDEDEEGADGKSSQTRGASKRQRRSQTSRMLDTPLPAWLSEPLALADAASHSSGASSSASPTLKHLAAQLKTVRGPLQARHHILVQLDALRTTLERDEKELVALHAQLDAAMHDTHQQVDQLIGEYLSLVTGEHAPADPLPIWEFEHILSRVAHSELYHHVRPVYDLLRHHQQLALDKHAAATAAAGPHADDDSLPSPPDVRLRATHTSLLLQSFVRAPDEGLETATHLLAQFQQPPLCDLFELDAASYSVVLTGFVERTPTDASQESAYIAQVRAAFDAIPVKDYRIYSVMLPVLLRYNLTDEVERLRVEMAALREVRDAGGAGARRGRAPDDADVMAMYVKSLMLELQHLLDANPGDSAPHCARLTARAEQVWTRAKQRRLLNPTITIAMIKMYKLVGNTTRVKALLKEALLLERAHTPKEAEAGAGAVAVAPVYVDALCFGAVFNAFAARDAASTEHVAAASQAFELLLRRHSEAAKAADEAGDTHGTSSPLFAALSTRAAALRVDGVAIKSYLMFLRASGQGEQMCAMWGRMSRAQKLHTPFAFVALLGHLSRQGDLRTIEREAERHDRDALPWDVLAFTALMSAYKDHGDWAGAERVMARIEAQGFAPDQNVYSTLIQAAMGPEANRQARVDELYQAMTSAGLQFRGADFLRIIRTAHTRGLTGEVIRWGERCYQSGCADQLDAPTQHILATTLRTHVRKAPAMQTKNASTAAAVQTGH